MSNAAQPEIPALIPLPVVARILGLSIPTIYRAVNRGEIPLAPIGGRRRVVTSELARIIGRPLRPSDFAPSTETPSGPDTGHAQKSEALDVSDEHAA